MPVARGSDDFTVPVPLQERGINVYECLEEERKAVKEMLFMGTCGSRVHMCAQTKMYNRVQCNKTNTEINAV